MTKATNLAKERKSISLGALAFELGVSLYYARSIAKTACDLDPSLKLDQLFTPGEGQGSWSLFDKAWFEEEQAKLRAKRGY